eukprot:COSAG06_NODE_19144_length_851_cov_2.259309_2_plen_203_part_01
MKVAIVPGDRVREIVPSAQDHVNQLNSKVRVPPPLRFLAHHQTRTNIRAMSDDDEVVMEVQDGEGSPELELNGDGVTASGDAAVATGAAEPGSPPAAEPGSPPVSPLLKSALECVSQSSEEALLELERRIAERRRKLVGEPRTHGLRYKAVRRAQLRQTIDLESQKLGSLDEGDFSRGDQRRAGQLGGLQYAGQSDYAVSEPH